MNYVQMENTIENYCHTPEPSRYQCCHQRIFFSSVQRRFIQLVLSNTSSHDKNMITNGWIMIICYAPPL